MSKTKNITTVILHIEHLDSMAGGKTRINYLVGVATLLLAAVCGPKGKARIATAKALQAHNLKLKKKAEEAQNLKSNPYTTIIMQRG